MVSTSSTRSSRAFGPKLARPRSASSSASTRKLSTAASWLPARRSTTSALPAVPAGLDQPIGATASTAWRRSAPMVTLPCPARRRS